jgi:hypothetical protein
MRSFLQFISWIALAGTILPSVFFYLGSLSLEQTKTVMLLATFAWFIIAPTWMGRKENTTAAKGS